MQSDPNTADLDLSTNKMVNNSGDWNIPANEVNGWDRLPVDPEPLLGPSLSALFLLIDPASHEPKVFFNSLFDDRM